MRGRARTILLLPVMLLAACGGVATPTRTVAPPATATTAPVATAAATALPAPTVTAGASVATPAPSASAFTLRLSVEDASIVSIDKHVPAAGQGNLLLRTAVANTSTKSQTVKGDYFRLRADGQELRSDEGATTAAEGVAKIKGFRSALGTSIDGGKAETHIIVFVVPLDAKQFTLLLKKDDKSTEDIADPLPVATQVAQAVAGYATATPNPTATAKPTVDTAGTDVAKAKGTAAASTSAAVQVQRAAAVKEYMDTNFSGASWYPSIRAYRLDGNQLHVDTTLFPKDSNKETAVNIRAALINYATDRDRSIDLIAIHDSAGNVLASIKPGR